MFVSTGSQDVKSNCNCVIMNHIYSASMINIGGRGCVLVITHSHLICRNMASICGQTIIWSSSVVKIQFHPEQNENTLFQLDRAALNL